MHTCKNTCGCTWTHRCTQNKQTHTNKYKQTNKQANKYKQTSEHTHTNKQTCQQEWLWYKTEGGNDNGGRFLLKADSVTSDQSRDIAGCEGKYVMPSLSGNESKGEAPLLISNSKHLRIFNSVYISLHRLPLYPRSKHNCRHQFLQIPLIDHSCSMQMGSIILPGEGIWWLTLP